MDPNLTTAISPAPVASLLGIDGTLKPRPLDRAELMTLYAQLERRYIHCDDQHSKAHLWLCTTLLGAALGAALTAHSNIPYGLLAWALPLLAHLHAQQMDHGMQGMLVMRDLAFVESLVIPQMQQHYALYGWQDRGRLAISGLLIGGAAFGAACLIVDQWLKIPWPWLNGLLPIACFLLIECFAIKSYLGHKKQLAKRDIALNELFKRVAAKMAEQEDAAAGAVSATKPAQKA